VCVCVAQQRVQPAAPPVPSRGPRNQTEDRPTLIVSSFAGFLARHAYATSVTSVRPSVRPSVCLSVCLSVALADCDHILHMHATKSGNHRIKVRVLAIIPAHQIRPGLSCDPEFYGGRPVGMENVEFCTLAAIISAETVQTTGSG